jgi:hypothetical protein
VVQVHHKPFFAGRLMVHVHHSIFYPEGLWCNCIISVPFREGYWCKCTTPYFIRKVIGAVASLSIFAGRLLVQLHQQVFLEKRQVKHLFFLICLEGVAFK